MNDSTQQKSSSSSSPVSGVTIPLLIILLGALIVFGVTRILGGGQGHIELVEELHSKKFGNRWVAAYELSKYIVSESIPQEDYPWLIEQLTQVYKQSQDDRTQAFIVKALSALKDVRVIPFLNEAMKSEEKIVRFNAVIGLGHFVNQDLDIVTLSKDLDFTTLKNLASSGEDPGLQQVALLTYGLLSPEVNEEFFRGYLAESHSFEIRYAALAVLLGRGVFEGLISQFEDAFASNNTALAKSVSDETSSNRPKSQSVEAELEAQNSKTTLNDQARRQMNFVSVKLNLISALNKRLGIQTIPKSFIEVLRTHGLKDPNQKIKIAVKELLSKLKKQS